MPKGHRRYVLTPGQKETLRRWPLERGDRSSSPGSTRRTKAGELFHELVWKLLGEYYGPRRVHFILDNYIINPSKRT